MVKTREIQASKKELYAILEEALKDEIEHITKTRPNELKGCEYEVERGKDTFKYHILEFDFDKGYILNIDNKDGTFTLTINLEELENSTNLIYVNEYDAKKFFSKLNYNLMSKIFKRKIESRYESLIAFLESKIEVNNNE